MDERQPTSLSPGDAMRQATALELAHFAATGVAILASAAHRGKPIGDKEIKHLLRHLATAAANAPEQSKFYFDGIAEMLAGKQYEGR